MRPARLALGLLVLASLLVPAASRAAFHLYEITKIMTSHDGDATVQAVEMKALTAGENLVNTASLIVFDVDGNEGATLGTFTSDLPAAGAVNGARILFATMRFRQRFGITPDLEIPPGLLATDGQVLFRKPTCVVNAVAYGAVATPIGGNTTSAAPIPSGNAPILVRILDSPTGTFCPLAENAAARFQLVTASPTNPVIFTNWSGNTASVTSSVTGVGGTPAVAAPRAYPNPFRDRLHVETTRPARVAVYDVRGTLVARLGTTGGGSQRVTWDGRDSRGRRAPEGVYFIGVGERENRTLRRVVLLR